ncbi:hypothetical protein HELRODRAFT_158305 [Helobdella robusta]|uniref:Uncharacterized protein n=1 Tax=Helobdella robusta TaxID=6412 RepID=T1EMM3_HELRO|nr:hypothetical protein HELRODRAFT_158305 [Helobdella robusta]ESO11942.1 hypothetical protein HELRODRAFT_158305 [Helobdella robusta]
MDNNDDSIHSPQSSENHEQFEVQNDEEKEEAPVQEVSTKMALQCARKLTFYSIHMGNRELLQFSENIENILEIEFISKKILMLSLEERTVKRRGQFGHSPTFTVLENRFKLEVNLCVCNKHLSTCQQGSQHKVRIYGSIGNQLKRTRYGDNDDDERCKHVGGCSTQINQLKSLDGTNYQA